MPPVRRSKRQRFHHGTNLYDFTIKTDTEQFEVHKSILETYSGYFNTYFQSKFQPEGSNSIDLIDVDADVLRVLIHGLYTHNTQINTNNVYEVLALADYLQISFIVEDGCNFVIENSTSENCVLSWIVLKRYNMGNTKEVLSGLDTSSLSVLTSAEVRSLQIKDFETILRHIANRPLKNIFTCIVSWVEHNQANREQYFEKLFDQHISADLISKCSFHITEIIANKPFVKNSSICLRKISDARRQLIDCYSHESRNPIPGPTSMDCVKNASRSNTTRELRLKQKIPQAVSHTCFGCCVVD